MADGDVFEVFVKGLPADVSEDELLGKFEQCGQVKRIRIIRPDDRKGKGKQLPAATAFVVYGDKESGNAAIATLTGAKIREHDWGSVLTVEWSRKAMEYLRELEYHRKSADWNEASGSLWDSLGAQPAAAGEDDEVGAKSNSWNDWGRTNAATRAADAWDFSSWVKDPRGSTDGHDAKDAWENYKWQNWQPAESSNWNQWTWDNQRDGQGKATASSAPANQHEWNDQLPSNWIGTRPGKSPIDSRFAAELETWLRSLDRDRGEMMQFHEAILRNFASWDELREGALEEHSSQELIFNKDFLTKIGLTDTGHDIFMRMGFQKLMQQKTPEQEDALPSSAQPGIGSQGPPQAEAENPESDCDSEVEDENCIRVFVCIMARGVELTLNVPRASTVARVMTELEELEGVEHGAQYLFSSSQPRMLQPEDEVADGAQLFLSSSEDARMLSLLPEHVRPHVNPASLVDVVLDLDRKPLLHQRDSRGQLRKRILDMCPVVEQEDLDTAEKHDLLARRWTKDNRSGISGTLHRVARILDHYGDRTLTGLTLRMARPMYGLTEQVPLLRKVIEDGKSLLVLGPPGSGKTTLLREVARALSEEFDRRVFVVDTSGEICGFGRSAHVAVGRTTRRMQVADRNLQHQDMLEAVQNHTPEVLVIDEIGSQEEVEAASRIGFKGVSLVATAHANNLKEAMDNVALQSLFGGFERSTVSDQTAQRTADGRKFVEQRRSAPVFKSLVELGRGSGDEWVVHEDLQGAVDMILARRPALGSRVPAPSTHARAAGRTSGANYQPPPFRDTPPAAAKTQAAQEQSARPPKAGAALAAADIEARRSMRDREISGRAYRLCFDGGVSAGSAGPGGAGAILRRLQAGTGHPDRRSSKTWMLYHPKSCPELMEYAGLLIGLRGVLQLLPTLRPAPDVIFPEGDCKLVVDRHGSESVAGARAARGLQSEHPDAEAKLDTLAELVDEAISQLEQQNIIVANVKWRNRARNKAADRLSHQARDWKQSSMDLGADVMALLKAFETSQVPTVWHMREYHPMLRIQESQVMHPQHLAGFVGLELKPDSLDGSFSLTVRVDGRWGRADSFLLGVLPTGAVHFAKARNIVASDVGFWFSPKSGTVCGKLKDQTAQFLLPSLMNAKRHRTRCGLAAEGNKPPLLEGVRWGMSYRRGTLELSFAMPDEELQSLGNVKWPWGELLPEKAYSAAILFTPRRTGYGSAPVAERPASMSPRRHRARSVRGGSSDAPGLTLLGERFTCKSLGWELHWSPVQGPHPSLEFLCDLTEGELRHIRCCRQCFAKRCSDPDTENFLRTLEEEVMLRWQRTRPPRALDADMPIQAVSPGVRISGRSIYHPQSQRHTCWVQFPANFGSRLAIKLAGHWSRHDGILIGVTPEAWKYGQAAKDLGYFFSPQSRSMIGCDGTNFSWPKTVEEVWGKQLQEQLEEAEAFEFGSRRVHELGVCEGECWCVRRSEKNVFEIHNSCCASGSPLWVQLGTVPWKTKGPADWKDWYFTVIFKPRASRPHLANTGNWRCRHPAAAAPHAHRERRESKMAALFKPPDFRRCTLAPPSLVLLTEEELAKAVWGGAPTVSRRASDDGVRCLDLTSCPQTYAKRLCNAISPVLPDDVEIMLGTPEDQSGAEGQDCTTRGRNEASMPAEAAAESRDGAAEARPEAWDHSSPRRGGQSQQERASQKQKAFWLNQAKTRPARPKLPGFEG